MTYTLTPNGEYMYVRRKPTQSECDRYIRNGYTPPELEREHDRDAYTYARGETQPNYPMPAIPMICVISSDRVTHYFLRAQRYKIWRKEK